MTNYYRVYYLNRFKKAFNTRDKALKYVSSQDVPEDYEIRDWSDEL